MKITLEKSMSFTFPVHSTNSEVVGEAVRQPIHHFEETLKYKVGLVIRDSGNFPKEIHATKRTKVKVQKERKKEKTCTIKSV